MCKNIFKAMKYFTSQNIKIPLVIFLMRENVKLRRFVKVKEDGTLANQKIGIKIVKVSII